MRVYGVSEARKRVPSTIFVRPYIGQAHCKTRLLRYVAGVRFGSWSCENALTEAQVRRDLSRVAQRGDFSIFCAFFDLRAILGRFSGRFLRTLLEPTLHRFKNVLVLPAGDPPFLAGGATVLDGAVPAGIGPIAA
jgi:hypothetical protein